MKRDYKGRPICPKCNCNITYIEMEYLKGCSCGYKLQDDIIESCRPNYIQLREQKNETI